MKQLACDGRIDQRWIVRETEAGSWSLQNVGSRLCAGVDGAAIALFGCADEPSRRWILEH